ncbi:P-loop containing nucleoside triphosphate hydrolase protein [Podospora appendiculata]|uniref:P-loop containing nucleoside triphosphate hydrolase protein n=1 Tax=Podospora appendiculata TaxID=314037 RepID=A0AAE1CE38_9PEZI|nr:P-loop containing nucleoside triphosphate hydrolase protein [Podospora appendiculata]
MGTGTSFTGLYYAAPLLILPAIYFLRSPKKDAAKPPSKAPPNASFRWRKAIDDLRVYLPLVIPKDKIHQRRMLSYGAVTALCISAGRLVKAICPVLMRRIIDKLGSPAPTGAAGLPWMEIALFVLLRNVATSLVTSVNRSIRTRASRELGSIIKLTLYNKLLDQTAEYHDNKRSGSMWTAISDSGAMVVEFFSFLVFHEIPMVLDIAVGVGTCWTVFDGSLGLAMVCVMAVYVAVSVGLPSEMRMLFQSFAGAKQRAVDIGYDTILNWQTVADFNRFDHERTRFSNAVHAERELQVEMERPFRWMGLWRNVAAGAGVGLVCLLGCYEIQKSNRGAGDFVMLFQFWTELFSTVDMLLDSVTMLEHFLADSSKIREIMQIQPAVRDKEDAVDFELDDGTIEFENVRFSYDGQRETVRGVSFKVGGGQTVAIVGETGGGKSTLVKLLCRAYDVTDGAIKTDGQDLRSVRLSSFREHLSVVPQSIGVFNMSILENLRYANLEASTEQIEDACRAAALHDKIIKFQDGYAQVVGEKGVKLSGGELQRLAIARALLRKARIVLLDEATSNLDAETEERIQGYLKKWYAGRTVVVVAHRLATVANADLIISFKDGQIVEAGRHDELLARRGYFYQLWNKQRLAWDPSKGEDVSESVDATT